jgi:eukaryotic translation initiation factor 2-alpha kinase 4
MENMYLKVAKYIPVPVKLNVVKKEIEPPSHSSVDIRFLEDLSGVRRDEETVLEAVYGSDFQRKAGAWGRPRFEVNVRPPDLEPQRIGCHLMLSISPGNNYPYTPPTIILRNVKGLSRNEKKELTQQLEARATELAATGSVMILELVQVAEDYLIEHNNDPTMSAWEQMKAREALAKSNEIKAQQEIERIMSSTTSAQEIVSPKHSNHSFRVTFQDEDSDTRPQSGMSEDIEREYARQRAALEAAQSKPLELKKLRSDSLSQTDDFDDDEYLQYDPNLAKSANSSRYETDFIELGVLGRGGGGEVVKVRNRLDRRIYAVKKILLEPEQGNNANLVATQNQKLLREVTTISSMTHTHIVRYYQAWIEGGNDSSHVDTIEEELETNESDDSHDSSSDGDNGVGFWHGSPVDNQILTRAQQQYSDLIEPGNTLDIDQSNSDIFGTNTEYERSNLLDDEYGTMFQSPLLTGLGFQNNMYTGFYENKDNKSKKDNPSNSTNSDEWDESSVKVTGKTGQAILYIQMEYCSTTLRELIDKQALQAMADKDTWRLIRQILEALKYLHLRDIIHRDLVSDGLKFLCANPRTLISMCC